MPNMRATAKARHAIMVPVTGTVQIRLEDGSLGTEAGRVCDWGVMLWGAGFCDVEGAAVFCDVLQMLDVCVLDDPVCCWLNFDCTTAMDATIMNPYGSYNRVTFFYII